MLGQSFSGGRAVSECGGEGAEGVAAGAVGGELVVGGAAGGEEDGVAGAGVTAALYAVWRPNAYTIRFLPNGAEGTMADQAACIAGAASPMR